MIDLYTSAFTSTVVKHKNNNQWKTQLLSLQYLIHLSVKYRLYLMPHN